MPLLLKLMTIIYLHLFNKDGEAAMNGSCVYAWFLLFRSYGTQSVHILECSLPLVTLVTL